MIDPDLTAVLPRRGMAFAIDFGLISLLTALVARSQFEGFPVDPQAWTPEEFDRLVTLKDDRFHRMQEIGDTQHVISGAGLLITLAVGLVFFTILFVLLPAITGWSPGKKLLGIRVAGIDGSTPSLGQLITRSVALVVDLLPFVIPGLLGLIQAVPSKHHQRFGDRVAGTVVADAAQLTARAAINLDVDERLRTGEQSAPSTGKPAPEDSTTQDSTTQDSAAAEPALPIAPGSSTPGQAPPPPDHKKIDASEFLDPQPVDPESLKRNPALAGPPSADDLVEATNNPAPSVEPMLFDEPLAGESLALEDVGLNQPKAAKAPIEPPASLAGPPSASSEVPSGNPDDRNIDFALDPEPTNPPTPVTPAIKESELSRDEDQLPDRDSMFSASSKPNPEVQTSKVAHPPPAHRREQPRPDDATKPAAAAQWDRPKAEPAPVWRPEGDGVEPASTKPAGQPAHRDTQPAQSTAAASSSEPVDPVWSDDWQAWLYWDAKRKRWLRHDVDNNKWISIS